MLAQSRLDDIIDGDIIDDDIIDDDEGLKTSSV